MSDAKLLGEADPSVLAASGQVEAPIDVDPAETSEWLGSLDYVYKSRGADRVRYLVKALENRARREYDSPVEATRLSRESRAGTPHQEHHSLECDGHGGAGEQEKQRSRWAY